ncbi:MAG TPA: hypothetical protein VI258_04650, partial [Rhodanobacteraceae bacterium]
CDVHLQPTPAPARWLNAAPCFDPARYANGFFVLLASEERDAARAARLTATIGVPSEVREAGGYEIWTYLPGASDLAWLTR